MMGGPGFRPVLTAVPGPTRHRTGVGNRYPGSVFGPHRAARLRTYLRFHAQNWRATEL